MTDHVIKEHNKEDKSWLLRDSWVRREGSKDSKLMKRKRQFTPQWSLIFWHSHQYPICTPNHYFTFTLGRAVTESFRRWFVIKKPRVQSRVTACQIRGGRSDIGTDFSPSFFGFPLPIIIPLFLLIYHRYLSAS
jgi:hypothetical protein